MLAFTRFYRGGLLTTTKLTRKSEGHYTTTILSFFIAAWLFICLPGPLNENPLAKWTLVRT